MGWNDPVTWGQIYTQSILGLGVTLIAWVIFMLIDPRKGGKGGND